jgi:hypothetical protein
MNYERLSAILDRQQRYRVLDIVAALVLVIGLGIAVATVALQLPAVSGETSPDHVMQVDHSTPGAYTAQLLDDADNADEAR